MTARSLNIPFRYSAFRAPRLFVWHSQRRHLSSASQSRAPGWAPWGYNPHTIEDGVGVCRDREGAVAGDLSPSLPLLRLRTSLSHELKVNRAGSASGKPDRRRPLHADGEGRVRFDVGKGHARGAEREPGATVAVE